jgi:hypothetical protein
VKRPLESRRKWATIVLAVVLLLLVLLYVRPRFFSGIRPNPETTAAETSSPTTSNPDAIIAIQVDVENTWRPIDVTPIPVQPEPTPVLPAPSEPADAAPSPDGGGAGLDSLDLDAEGARVSGGSTATHRVIPPRPVEITWPETSRLKECIGRHVEVDIRVDENGTVLQVDPVDQDFPEECLRSALNAAAQIRFLPGTVDGKPATLSTRVRIDFEKRK